MFIERLALMLTLCLVVTMLPGIGFSEDEIVIDELEVQIEEQLPGDDEQLDIIDEAEIDEGLIDIDLGLDLEAPSESIQLEELAGNEPADEGESAEQPEEAPDDGSASNETTPHVDPDGPQLVTNEKTMGVGEFFYLEPKLPDSDDVDSITYQSSDSSVAKVYKSGRVTAVAEGFACITATAENGSYSECFVYVKISPLSVLETYDTV